MDIFHNFFFDNKGHFIFRLYRFILESHESYTNVACVGSDTCQGDTMWGATPDARSDNDLKYVNQLFNWRI